MADKIEIEVYKGQTIFYNEDSDKFECDISVEDKFKSTKRQSLKDARKEIDTFIKLNLEFKPFKCFKKSSYGSDVELVEITGIRTDGKLIEKKSGYRSSDSHLDKKDMEKLCAYDSDVWSALDKSEKENDEVNKKYNTERIELIKKLKPLDLSKYDALINPKKEETLVEP